MEVWWCCSYYYTNCLAVLVRFCMFCCVVAVLLRMGRRFLYLNKSRGALLSSQTKIGPTYHMLVCGIDIIATNVPLISHSKGPY